MKDRLRHLFNPLHVYCRLVDCGLDRRRARRVCGFYSRLYRIVL